MRQMSWCALALMVFVLETSSTNARDDWPIWRGPSKNGIAPANQKPPTEWDESTNIIWKTKIPGRGHSSPIIVDDNIFLTTSDVSQQTQSVVCFDRSTGKQRWITEVNKGGLEKRIHPSNTHASPTIVTSGNRLFAVFNNNGGVQLACLDYDGNIVWQKPVGPFTPRFPFGFGSSPCIHQDHVIVMSDYPSQGFIAAFNQSDGSQVWRTKRGLTSSYASPIVADIAGKNQLIVSGSDVRSYDPENGQELWNTKGPWQVTCGTLVWEDDMVFVSGGFPTPGTMAIDAKTSEIVWQNQIKCYEQSLLVYDGHVYAISDEGIAFCWRAKDGKQMWKERVLKKKVSSSPIFAAGNIYMTNESGTTIVIKANPKQFEKVAENQLGSIAFATPAIVDSRIYTRVGTRDNDVQEWLYCIGETK